MSLLSAVSGPAGTRLAERLPGKPGRGRPGLGLGQPLPRVDRHVDGVLGRRQRAHPARVVPARRVVREVEVDDDALAVRSEVGALRRVEHVAATAVAGAAGGRVPERQEEAAAVLIQPPQRSRRPTGAGIVTQPTRSRRVTPSAPVSISSRLGSAGGSTGTAKRSAGS